MIRERINEIVIIDPGNSGIKIEKNSNKLIQNEKSFLMNIVSKIFAHTERDLMNISDILKFDSYSEFLDFFEHFRRIHLEKTDIEYASELFRNFLMLIEKKYDPGYPSDLQIQFEYIKYRIKEYQDYFNIFVSIDKNILKIRTNEHVYSNFYSGNRNKKNGSKRSI